MRKSLSACYTIAPLPWCNCRARRFACRVSLKWVWLNGHRSNLSGQDPRLQNIFMTCHTVYTCLKRAPREGNLADRSMDCEESVVHSILSWIPLRNKCNSNICCVLQYCLDAFGRDRCIVCISPPRLHDNLVEASIRERPRNSSSLRGLSPRFYLGCCSPHS